LTRRRMQFTRRSGALGRWIGDASHPPPRLGRGDWGIDELIVALRWTGFSLSVLTMLASAPSRRDIIAASMLLVYSILRTLWPVHLGRTARRTLIEVTLDAFLGAGLVGWTGLAASPFLLSLGASLLLAGLGIGAAVALLAPATAGVAVLASWAVGGFDASDRYAAAQRGGLLALICLLGAYSRWLLRPAHNESVTELERLRSLSEVNNLLLELHARAASLPGSVSLRGVLAQTVSRLRDLLQPQLVALLLRDPTAERSASSWRVAVAEGVQLPVSLSDEELPTALREAARSLGPVRRERLEPGDGLGAGTSSGLYIPLWARESLVGLLAIERLQNSPPFSELDVNVVADVAQHAGLAIDNARWFRRLRTLGADEERGRIARDLHDRAGQALAFVALSLDRVGAEVGADRPLVPLPELRSELASLAAEIRLVSADIREKLSDLRMETSEDLDVEAALARLLTRVEERSGVSTVFEHTSSRRLGPIVEREAWLIAQEAILNAERHADALTITVRWRCESGGTQLEVVDDGNGTAATAPLRRNAYGILGMRERADAIGASLAISSTPEQGTTVRLRIEFK